MKILFVSPWFPFPIDNGIRNRLYHLIYALARHHQVWLLSFVRSTDRPDTKELERFCHSVQTVPWHEYNPREGKSIIGFMSSMPRSLVDTYSHEMEQRVRKLTTAENFDVVIASTIDTAEYVRYAPARVKVLEEHNSMTRWMQDNYRNQKSWRRRAREWLTFVKFCQYEMNLYAHFDGCTMVSELDRRAVVDLLHFNSPIGVVPNGVDPNYFAPADFTRQAHTMIFNGSLSYSVNRDAVTYFADEILPLIRQQSPDARLLVTGRIEGVPLRDSLRQPGIVLTGYLDDIRPTLGQATVCVVPLRTGGGTRLKILEAMAMGTPVVSTTKGAEGLDVTDGKEILIADAPADFAKRVLSVFDDASLRARLTANARRLVQTQYDWNSIGDQFERFIQELVEQRSFSRESTRIFAN